LIAGRLLRKRRLEKPDFFRRFSPRKVIDYESNKDGARTMVSETSLREKLAACTRILAMQGLIGLFGHVSVFDPQRRRVFMSPSQGFDKTGVTEKDILISRLDGSIEDGDARLPLEWPIHMALHERRADALAVAHLHAPYATLFSMTERAFRPVTLQGSIFCGGIPTYTQPHLVKSMEQGIQIADLICDRPAAFMRGHGIIVVARDIEQMLFSTLILEDEAQKQIMLSSMGDFRCISDEDCAAFGAAAELPGRAQRAWTYYCGCEKRLGHAGGGPVPFV